MLASVIDRFIASTLVTAHPRDMHELLLPRMKDMGDPSIQ